ncbi:MAG: hypothetical protein FJ304_01535 [Planctomycetes bacterium]|nr:hypothetical protein [Planctomycetota bacterium]
MTASLVLLAAGLATPPSPVPDGKTFDALTYTFGGGGGFGAGGSLAIKADGKVTYFYSSAPHTGSGGRVVKKDWTITKDEKTELFAKLVAAGLLDMPAAHAVVLGGGGFQVSSGKWTLSLGGANVPDKVLDALRPLLAKADDKTWPPSPVKAAKPEPVVFQSFGYTLVPKANGRPISLYVTRAGGVQYRRVAAADAPDGKYYAVEKDWKLTAKEAESLFDALAADGLFDLDDAGAAMYPSHTVTAHAGRWSATFAPKELPAKVTKHLLPLLKKADADYWK